VQVSQELALDASSFSLGSVLLVDDDDIFCSALGRSFCKMNYETWGAVSLSAAREILEHVSPAIVVSEAQIGGESALPFIAELNRRHPETGAVIVTAYPSTSSTERAVRAGVRAYLAKPVTADLILDALNLDSGRTPAAECVRQSLDLTIWEYLNHAFLSAGSMSEAARRLGIDRRSLRRMLAKNPPAR
jgi:two-component system response regulator RegA